MIWCEFVFFARFLLKRFIVDGNIFDKIEIYVGNRLEFI
jgi:hypothetical protein